MKKMEKNKIQDMEASKASRQKHFAIAAALVLTFAVMVMPSVVLAAGTDGGPLTDTYDTLTIWTQGNVGKVITLAFMVVGIIAGIARSSLMAFAIGIGAGLGIYNAPAIVDTIFSATL